MEHKSTRLEIVSELLAIECHAREVARRLHVNHTVIIRKLKELQKENVVDYREEGRNKVYFLKKTIEAKNMVYAAEGHKLSKTLRKYPTLRLIIEKVQKETKVKLAMLFGSYAKGMAKPESDIDIFVETTDRKIKRDLEMVNTKLSVKIGRYDKGNLLLKEIEKNHVIIKGVEEYYEKIGFFE